MRANARSRQPSGRCPPSELKLPGLSRNSLFRCSMWRDMLQPQHRTKKAWIPFWCVLLLCLPIVGCSRDDLLKHYGYDRASLLRNMPKEDEVLARDSVDLLRSERFDDLESRLDPSIRGGDIRGKLAEMSSFFPSKPISVKTVEAGFVRSHDSSTTKVTLEYQFERSWLLAHVVIRTKGGFKRIAALSVTPTSEQFEVMNEFTFADKGFSQYAGLLLALSVAALTLYAFVSCVRMKIGPPKWAWLLAILVGVCRISVNWTTGQWFFTPLALRIPPVTAACTAYGPWILHIFSPLGAIAFLRLRKRLALEVLPLTIVPDTVQASEISAGDRH